jgi:hypothetical protein
MIRLDVSTTTAIGGGGSTNFSNKSPLVIGPVHNPVRTLSQISSQQTGSAQTKKKKKRSNLLCNNGSTINRGRKLNAPRSRLHAFLHHHSHQKQAKNEYDGDDRAEDHLEHAKGGGTGVVVISVTGVGRHDAERPRSVEHLAGSVVAVADFAPFVRGVDDRILSSR